MCVEQKKIGGADGAMALYADVFEKTLRPLEDEQDEEQDREGRAGGGGQGARAGGDDYPAFFVWHGTAVRAEYLGFGVYDGKPDRLWEEDSEKVLWERGGAYCPLAALLDPASVELLHLCALSASLAIPLELAYAEDPIHRYTHRHIDTYTQAESNSSEAQFEVLSTHGVSQTPGRGGGEVGGGGGDRGRGGVSICGGDAASMWVGEGRVTFSDL
jgi:hypothetical protein